MTNDNLDDMLGTIFSKDGNPLDVIQDICRDSVYEACQKTLKKVEGQLKDKEES